MRPMLVPIVVRPKHRPKNITHSLAPPAEKRQALREEQCVAIEAVHCVTAKGQRDIPSR